MPTFRFKYDAVLRQRQAAEEQCQHELAKHLRRRGELRDHLHRMQQTVRDAKSQLSGGLVGHVDVDRIREFAGYSGQVTMQAQDTIRQLAQVEQHTQQARQQLAEAMRQRKAMELLRDKHYKQWLAEQNRQEREELDELAMQRYTRGLMTEGTP